MKSKILMTIGVALCLAAAMAQPLHAQGSQYSPQAAEEVRAELLNLVDAIQEAAALAPRDLVDSDSLQQARLQIQQMPGQSIHAFGKGIDPAKLRTRLPRPRTLIREYSQGRPAMNTYMDMNMLHARLLRARAVIREHSKSRPDMNMDTNMGMNQSLIFAEGCENIAISVALR